MGLVVWRCESVGKRGATNQREEKKRLSPYEDDLELKGSKTEMWVYIQVWHVGRGKGKEGKKKKQGEER